MDLQKNDGRNGEREITLSELLRLIREGRWILIVTTVLTTSAALATALLIPSHYRAETIISPVSDQSSNGLLGGLGALASQFGGLSSIAELPLGNSSKTAAESKAVLQSEALTTQYIVQNNLLPVIYADRWNSASQKWKTDSASQIPTPWMAFRYFKKNIFSLTPDPKSGLLTLTITWTDPKLAANWANGLVRMTNIYLRDKAIRESERNIAYLTSEAARTDIVPVKQAIYSLMQNEINKSMAARGSEEYAFKILDPAVVPERPSYPQKLPWAIAGAIGGFILSLCYILMKAAMA